MTYIHACGIWLETELCELNMFCFTLHHQNVSTKHKCAVLCVYYSKICVMSWLFVSPGCFFCFTKCFFISLVHQKSCSYQLQTRLFMIFSENPCTSLNVESCKRRITCAFYNIWSFTFDGNSVQLSLYLFSLFSLWLPVKVYTVPSIYSSLCKLLRGGQTKISKQRKCIEPNV